MMKIIAHTVLALAIAVPAAAFAQFSMPSIPGVGKSSGGSTADAGAQQDALVRAFVAANKDVLRANAKMSEALGLKDQASEAQASADQLGDGATKGNLEASNKAVADTGGAIAAAMAKKPVLDAQAKETYAAGVVLLASGVNKYTGLGKGVKDMSSSLSSASPMMLPKLQSAAYLVSNIPSSATEVGKALKNAIDFARSNDIKLPADATSAV